MLPPIHYFPGALQRQYNTHQLLHALQTQLNRQQYPIRMFGKTVMQPRLVSFAGDTGISYTYSQTMLTGSGRPPLLAQLKTFIQTQYSIVLNSVLCNRYRNGHDSMGRHADDEPELGPDPVIVSMSLGASRTFALKHKKIAGRNHRIVLHDGDILIMDRGCQTDWLHAIPKTTKPLTDRINLTWRQIINNTK
ncbi:MAG: alpha-ketoglutarate-dependent dioxygenase AlkB [Candidatus Absconditabacterales bacterium]|nr:alpha-ketoglutarate-dependent dioxygenase AlkB [Candidatus Absconditabacterales bacterium]